MRNRAYAAFLSKSLPRANTGASAHILHCCRGPPRAATPCSCDADSHILQHWGSETRTGYIARTALSRTQVIRTRITNVTGGHPGLALHLLVAHFLPKAAHPAALGPQGQVQLACAAFLCNSTSVHYGDQRSHLGCCRGPPMAGAPHSCSADSPRSRTCRSTGAPRGDLGCNAGSCDS